MPVEVLRAPGEPLEKDDDLLSGKLLRDSLPPIFYVIGFGLPLVFITAGFVLYFDRGERFGIVFLTVGLIALGFITWQSSTMRRSGFTFDNDAQELRERATPQRALLHYSDIAGFSVRKHTYKTSDEGKIVTQTSHETLLQTKAGLLIPIETFYSQPSTALKLAQQLSRAVPYARAQPRENPLPSVPPELRKGVRFQADASPPYVEIFTRPAFAILALYSFLLALCSLAVPVEKLGLRPWVVALCVGIFPSIVALPLMFLSLKRWQLSQKGNQISVQFRSATGTRRTTTFPAAELTGAFFTTASHGVSDALVLWRGALPPLAPSPQCDETFELDAESDAAIPISIAGVAGQDRLLLAHHLLRMLRR